MLRTIGQGVQVPRVVILTLHDPQRARAAARVPVLACADALRAGGAGVDVVTATNDSEIDAAVKPVEAGEARLVVAAATDAELRGVVRRLVRRAAPPPSKRPAELPGDRTMFDLPPLAVLALTPSMPALLRTLDLPTTPDAVAAAVLAGRQRRLDLLRTDAGSVTLHGVLLGGAPSAVPFKGRVECDDTVLSEGDEPLLACAIANAGRSDVDGLPLVVDASADDGLVEVAIAVPVLQRRLLRPASVRVEVRRARGRAMSITPYDEELPMSDDGVAGPLTRKRSWWTERGAWALYT
jgi:hypothetical protein